MKSIIIGRPSTTTAQPDDEDEVSDRNRFCNPSKVVSIVFID